MLVAPSCPTCKESYRTSLILMSVASRPWPGQVVPREETWTTASQAVSSRCSRAGFLRRRLGGHVPGARTEASDDYWGGAPSRIELDPSQFGVDAVAELNTFSHVEVVFRFHMVQEGAEERGACHPRGNPDWSAASGVAQREAPAGPVGVMRCRLVEVDGLVLTVDGLDAIDGAPAVDITPCMREFDPRGDITQGSWSTTVMERYFARTVRRARRSRPHDALAASVTSSVGAALALRSRPEASRLATAASRGGSGILRSRMSASASPQGRAR